jgi:hypothetical protein
MVGDQLKTFLEANPKMPKDLMLVDDYSFNAFKEMGFGKIGENPELAIKVCVCMCIFIYVYLFMYLCVCI